MMNIGNIPAGNTDHVLPEYPSGKVLKHVLKEDFQT